jgi:aspartate racemase
VWQIYLTHGNFEIELYMHKKIGIIGGLSPESTASYYLHITRTYVERFGDDGYPEIIIYSVNLENYHRWRSAGRWDLIADDLTQAAVSIQKAGADFGLIATNTMHKVFDEVQSATSLPLINLIEVTAAEAKQQQFKTVGLLGTSFTMSESFYKSGLEKHGLSVVVPSADDQAVIHKIIMEELVRGKFLDASKQHYLVIIEKLKALGAEAIILGCTEIPLLVNQTDCDIPLIDTAKIHAEAALSRAIKN